MIKNMLREGYGYNLRERGNIYAGAALGALIPAALIYAGVRQSLPDGGAILLSASLIASIPFSFAGLFLGAKIGVDVADKIQNKRFRESQLAQKTA